MKLKIIILKLFILVLSLYTAQAGDLILITGTVANLETGDPVPDHEVYVSFNNGFPDITFITNEVGFWGDSIFTGGIVIESVYIFTYDCNFQIHDTLIDPVVSPIIADFEICSAIYPPIDCENEFIFETQDTLTYTFEGYAYMDSLLIEPEAVEFVWEFGDGATGYGQSVTHTFESINMVYEVCLFTFVIDSLPWVCEAISCQEIGIYQPPDCNAAFHYALDSNNISPAVYYFYDISVGDYDQWFWDFGDGTSSTEQNPVHQFQDTLEHEVCLIISNTNPVMQCTDDTCMTILPPYYYDLGGFAFIGDYPLNNPVSTGDTARAILYRKTNNSLVAIDSLYFYELGYYWFTHLIGSEYLVKINLTENSEHYLEYLPTYSGDQFTWAFATPFTLSEDTYDKDIQLVTLPYAGQGPGEINGSVSSGYKLFKDGINRKNDIEIILLNNEDIPLKYVYTDAFGNFVFDDLALGSYKILADDAGMFSYPVDILLSSEDPMASGVQLALYESNVFGIEEKQTTKLLNIFPNPVEDVLNIELSIYQEDIIQVKVINLLGQNVYSNDFIVRLENEVLQIPVDLLPQGIYILQIIALSDIKPFSTKFIK